LFDILKKKPSESPQDLDAKTYFQELQFIDRRKKHWSKQNEEDPLQVVVFWVLIPIFLASISTTFIIILSMLFE
jgi:hypothetical protein